MRGMLVLSQILQNMRSSDATLLEIQMDVMQCSLSLSLKLRQPDGIYCLTTYVNLSYRVLLRIVSKTI